MQISRFAEYLFGQYFSGRSSRRRPQTWRTELADVQRLESRALLAAVLDQGTNVEASAAEDRTMLRPVVLEPEGHPSCCGTIFSWEAVPEAALYEVWMGSLDSSDTPLIKATRVGLWLIHEGQLPIGRLQIWVRARFQDGQHSLWGAKAFHYDQAPKTPELKSVSSPGDQLLQTFQWREVPGAVQYRLVVRNLTTQEIVVDEVVPQNEYTPATALSMGRLRAWIQAIGADGFKGSWSEPGNYTVSPTPTLNYQSSLNSQPLLSWSSVPAADSYQVYIQREGSVVVDQSGIVGRSFSSPTPLTAGYYRWWVRPYTADGRAGGWSDPGILNIGGGPILSEDSPSPFRTDVTLSWQPIDGASTYEVYVKNMETQQIAYRQQGFSAAEHRVRPLDTGSYRAWVRAFDENGAPGNWGPYLEWYVVNFEDAEAAIPVNPAASSIDRRPVFRWEAEADLQNFDIYLTDGQTTIERTVVNQNSWQPDEELSARVWQWWVRGYVDSPYQQSRWSESALVDLSGQAVLRPVTVPTNQHAVAVTWTPVAGATYYTLQIDNLTTEQNAVIRIQDLAASEFQMPSNTAAGTYRAWVRAIAVNSDTIAPWSLPLIFEIR